MSTLNPEQRLFIDGALVDAEGGQTSNVIDPATEEVSPGKGDELVDVLLTRWWCASGTSSLAFAASLLYCPYPQECQR